MKKEIKKYLNLKKQYYLEHSWEGHNQDDINIDFKIKYFKKNYKTKTHVQISNFYNSLLNNHKVIPLDFIEFLINDPYIISFYFYEEVLYKLIQHQYISEKFIEKFQDKIHSQVIWDEISIQQKLSERFIEKFHERVDWGFISRHQKLSEEFIEKFHDRVNWDEISIKQKLSEEFIIKFKDKVNWGFISMNQKLSERFLEKFQNKFDWEWITVNKKIKISPRFMINLYNNYEHDLFNILRYKHGLKTVAKRIELEIPTLLIEFKI